MKLGQRGHTQECKLADTSLTQPFEYKYAWQIGEAKFQILVNLWRTFRLQITHNVRCFWLRHSYRVTQQDCANNKINTSGQNLLSHPVILIYGACE